MKRLFTALLAVLFVSNVSLSARSFTLVSYNVENLFDLDGVANYEDYKPERYTPNHLAVKASNIAKVLAFIENGAGPDIAVFNEIEIDQTPASTVKDPREWLDSLKNTKLRDLRSPLSPELAGVPAEMWLLKACEDAGLKGYHIAQTDEKPGNYADGRPLSVHCVIFSRFPIKEVRTIPTPNARAILEVALDIDGHPLRVFANHWKSGAGDPVSEQTRLENAATLRARLDEIFKKDPSADVILCGDFNSHYNQNARYPEMKRTGIIDVLGSQGNELALRDGKADLYNLWFELPPEERGSDIFRNEWGTLMHILISKGLHDANGIQYEDNSFKPLRIRGMNADVQGRPIRWSRGGRPGGFSDHFPIIAKFRTISENATNKWIELKYPSTTAQGPGDALMVGSVNELFENAIDPAKEPSGANFKDGSYDGKVFRLDLPAKIDSKGIVVVTLNDADYEIFSPKKELRGDIRDQVQKTGRLKAFGEIGTYRDRWQFILHDKDWILSANK